MVTTEFSEFSYGFAVVSELIEQPGTGVRAPTFPSLNDEGKLGFDVAIPDNTTAIPLFLQFKRPEWLVSERAAQHLHFGSEYFRFPLRTGKYGGVDQHALLNDLEQRFPGQVLYVAARFSKTAELSLAFDAGSVLSQSFVARPSDFGNVQGAMRIAYSADPSQDFLRCSEVTRLEKPADEQLVATSLRGERQPVRQIEARLEEFLETLGDRRLQRTRLDTQPDPDREVRPLGRQATELRYALNVELLLAGAEEE